MARLSRIEAVERPPTLGRRAYQQIQQAIRDGVITHGEIYSENELAESLGMSRTPVREALIALNREGIVIIESQRGFRLREISEAERQEIFDLRSLLEAFVARRLTASATSQDLTRLHALVDEQERLGDADAASQFLALDEEFHLLQSEVLGLERTRAMMADLRGAMWLIGLEALRLPHRQQDVVAEHRAIIDAMESGDPDAAVNAVHHHLENTAGAIHST
jgi:DNA-binding GntR family transcriptional regulator